MSAVCFQSLFARAREGGRWLAAPIALGLAFTGCSSRGEPERLHPTRWTLVSSSSPDPPGRCADLGAHRLCWSASCPGGICLRSRPVPLGIRGDAAAYRCTGGGKQRDCEPRAQRAPGFRCQASSCSQEQPRLPDDGEWECADLAGAVLCRGGSEPAAIARPSADSGWICGPRRLAKTSEQVCLDLDPDLPSAQGIRACRFEIDGARLRRICERSLEPRLGDPCSHPDLCPAGSECFSGVCVPPSPSPNCWGDSDCELGQCRYGTCSRGAP